MSFFPKAVYTAWLCFSLVCAALLWGREGAFLPYFIANMLVMGVPYLLLRRCILKQAREKDPRNYDAIRLFLVQRAHPEAFRSDHPQVQQLIDEYKSLGGCGLADIILVILIGIVCHT